jgi:uncharacterized protein (TIGR03435 family)
VSLERERVLCHTSGKKSIAGEFSLRLQEVVLVSKERTSYQMTKQIRMVFIGFCFLGICAGDCIAIADKDGPKIGDVPPSLTLTKTLQGPPTADISWAKLKGKVVVLEFWATWCGPCRKAIPHLNDLVEQFKDKPVVFVSVTSESEDIVRMFLEKNPMKTWVGLDDYEVLNKAFHVQGIPHAVIVDADGHIAAIAHPAAIKPENLEEVLAAKKCSLPEPKVDTVDTFSDEIIPSQAPALFEISVREHKTPQSYRGPTGMWSANTNGCGFDGKIATVESALNSVFHKTSSRMSIKCKLPDGFYDFELRAPLGHSNELQKEFVAALRTTFGLDATHTTKIMDVYVMTKIITNAPGLQKVEVSVGGGGGAGGFQLKGSSMKGVAESLERALGKPVFDDTRLGGLFDVNMKWKLSEAEKQDIDKPDTDAVIAAARERLGLQLNLVQRPVEILEVSQASQ